MSRRLRLLLFGFAGLFALLLLALGAGLYLLRPDSFTAMLQAQARHAGLELTLTSPANPTLFPRPGLQLQGLTLSAQGATAPILLASHGRLVLPWRTLLGGPTIITRLEIDAPRVDLDALQAWLADLPTQPGHSTPTIPRIDAGVSIRNGSLVRGNSVLLREIALEAGSLAAGQNFPLSITAQDADGGPVQLRLSATPRMQADSLQLDHIDLHFSRGDALSLQLGGTANWRGAANASLQLAGKLVHSRIRQTAAAAYAVNITLTPANQHDPLLLALKMDGQSNDVDVKLPPLALADWAAQLGSSHGPQLAVPPGSGRVQMDQLDAGSVHIEGLAIQVGDNAPSSDSSAAAPAQSAVPKNASPQ